MSSPNLCTTALPEFWDRQAEKIIFLGYWCLRYDRQNDWKDLDYEVLPHPWDDRAAMHRAAAYEEETSNLLLNALAEFLNHVHGVKYTVQYWRIILFPWIIHYVQALHERYLCLRQAHRLYPDCRTMGLSLDDFNVPRFFWDHLIGSTDDPYNLQIYTSLMLAMEYSPELKSFQWNWQPSQNASGITYEQWVKTFKAMIREHLSKWAVRGPVLMVDMYLPRKQILQIIWRTKFKARLAELPKNDTEDWLSQNGRHPLRNTLASLSFSVTRADEFQRTLIRTLPHNFPLFYLEGYDACRTWAQTLLRRSKTKALITANAIDGNEPFKFLCAEAKEREAKLIAVQHGGSYGSALDNPFEKYERQASDEFWSLGWGADKDSVRAMPNPKLSLLALKRKKLKNTEKAHILFVGNIFPRYHYRTWSCPTANQVEQYLAWQISFLQDLTPKIRESLIFRPFPQDYGHSLRQRLIDACPDICLCEPGQDYYDALCKAVLVICDINQTTILESLAANIPTIAFWDPALCELRHEAERDYANLVDVGILYHLPEKAAAFLNSLTSTNCSIESWWFQDKVQHVRRAFINKYANTSDDWLNIWHNQLSSFMK